MGGYFHPPALAGWPWPVKDVEHPDHWALCEEQVLSKGPSPLPTIELVLNEIQRTCSTTPVQFYRFAPFSSYGGKKTTYQTFDVA